MKQVLNWKNLTTDLMARSMDIFFIVMLALFLWQGYERWCRGEPLLRSRQEAMATAAVLGSVIFQLRREFNRRRNPGPRL
jgi:hypothetical protein